MIGRALKNPFQALGRNIYTGVSDAWRDFVRPAGTSSTFLSQKAAKAPQSGDLSAIDGMDMSGFGARDMQRGDNRGWASRTMSGVAEWLKKKKKNSRDSV